MRWRIISLAVLFLLDRSVKRYVWLMSPSAGWRSRGFLSPVVNKNISFSLDVSWSGALLIPALFAITAFLAHRLLITYRRGDKDFFWWGLIVTGAASNLMDRITLGGVLDYIDLPFWPIFNLSDVYIFVGVVMLILGELRRRKPLPQVF